MSRTASLAFALVVLCVGSVAAVPVASDVRMTQNVATRAVSITYSLSEPGVVTLDIQTNNAAGGWASIGPGNVMSNLSGDVNVRVAAGSRTILWQPDQSWTGHRIDAGGIRAVVTAWSLNDLPDYMVLDLCATNAAFFYTSEVELPGGIGHDRYRTQKLVMRRIHAAHRPFRMGSPAGETGTKFSYRSINYDFSVCEKAREITLSADYYIGVFELTQGQYRSVKGCGYEKTQFSGYADSAFRPVDVMSWNDCRGALWPDNAKPSDSSFLGVLNSRFTLVDSFDLPTEAQWEFACRAGAGTALNSGKELENGWSCEKSSALDEVAWNIGNNSQDTEDGIAQTHPVGLKRPNAWGLYDMHGNVGEFCLDLYMANVSGLPTTDPAGPTRAEAGYASGSEYYVYRGGRFDSIVPYFRSAARQSNKWGWQTGGIGIRLCCRAEIK